MNLLKGAQIRPVGDSGLLFSWSSQMDLEANRKAVSLARGLRSRAHAGLVDLVPSYSSLLIIYEPWEVTPREILEMAREEAEGGSRADPEEHREIHRIPVVYGGQYGPDLDQVAGLAGLTPQEVVSIHTQREYHVFCLGFTPGFPYMGPVDEAIQVPRLETPRSRVRAGSVGLAGLQTGIYSMEAPGGWQLIGYTPVALFDPLRDPPALVKPGQKVKFREIKEACLNDYRPRKRDLAPSEMSRPALRVLSPGLFTTVQDGGRKGLMHLGLSRAGAADYESLVRANRLVGNHPEAALLEITAQGPHLAFLVPCRIALSGADLQARLDGRPIPVGQAAQVREGSSLSFGPLARGLRGYLAVSGGIDVPAVLGSRCTDTVARLGGLEGRPLRSGDSLALGRETQGSGPCHLDQFSLSQGCFQVRAVPGPQEEHFAPSALKDLARSSFQVDPSSDRMGLRLRGERPLSHSRLGPGILSEGICPGAVQVPGSGQPIVMLANAQTTGGYAKIAQVITPDLSRLAQAKPGDTVRFSLVSPQEARRLTRKWREDLLGPASRSSSSRYLVEAGGRRIVVEIREA